MMTVTQFLAEIRRVVNVCKLWTLLLCLSLAALGIALALTHPQQGESGSHWWFTAPAIVAGMFLVGSAQTVVEQSFALSRSIGAEERTLQELESIELWFREANYLLRPWVLGMATGVILGCWRGELELLKSWTILGSLGLVGMFTGLLSVGLVWISGSLRNLNLETREQLREQGASLPPRRERIEFRLPSC